MMVKPVPKIDPRTAEQVEQQVQVLLAKYLGDSNKPLPLTGFTLALVKIFARYCEIIIQRLNQVPEKNFLAFLNLLGASQLPPQPARVPLTFSLAAGSTVDGLVPAGTPVAAPPAEGEKAPVIFETERNLVVTPVQLVAVFAHHPEDYTFSDHTQQATGAKNGSFEPFSGDKAIEHNLYLACDELFTLLRTKTVTLIFQLPSSESGRSDEGRQHWVETLKWSYCNGQDWIPLDAVASHHPNDSKWEVSLTEKTEEEPEEEQSHFPLAPAKCWLNGMEAAWIRGQLPVPDPMPNPWPDPLPRIDKIATHVQVDCAGLLPDFGFTNTLPLDLSKDFYPFGEVPHLGDTLYLASQEVFSKAGATVTLQVTLNPGSEVRPSEHLAIAWEAFNGVTWKAVTKPSGEAINFNFTASGSVTFTLPDSMGPGEVNGKTAYWIRARISQGHYGTGTPQAPPVFTTLSQASGSDGTSIVHFVRGIMPGDRAYIPAAENLPELKATIRSISSQDSTLTLTFAYPVGTPVLIRPASGSPSSISTTLSQASPLHGPLVILPVGGINPGDRVFILKANNVLEPKAAIQSISPQGNNIILTLAYPVGTPVLIRPASGSPPSISTTLSQASPLHGPLVIPPVGGINRGDRVSIPKANYLPELKATIHAINLQGSTLTLTLTIEPYPAGTGVWIYPASDVAPPLVESLTIQSYEVQRSLSACLTCNDLNYEVYTAEAATPNGVFEPFKPITDTQPTLYLGCDRPFTPNQAATLYLQTEPPLYGISPLSQATPQDNATAQPVRLMWEYSSGNSAWSPLIVQDDTQAFARSGLITFLAPADFQSCQQFGQTRYWLRVIWQEGQFQTTPQLRRIRLNTTWASQTVTLTNEVLGSSTGEENQRFRTTQTPVLLGQHLEVREAERPSPAEGAEVVVTQSAPGRSPEIWVRWQEVPDFYGSGPRDRHYVLNHLTGELQFGDGLNGLIPPIGIGNIRMARYQTGGGVRGNRPAGSIVQLKTTIPYMENVTNGEAAAGGAEAETLEEVKVRMPRTVRHRNQAVTLEDYGDLARLASPEVARARCVPLRNLRDYPLVDLDAPKTTGAVSVIIVPRSAAAKPVPTQELVDRVRQYLQDHAIATATIFVVGPLYVKVTVTAIVAVAVTHLERAGAVEQLIQQQLYQFLHPLTGGFDRQGWAFGRVPYDSDLYRLIEGIPGVDHVRTLSVDMPDDPEGTKATGRFLIYSGTHSINLVFEEA